MKRSPRRIFPLTLDKIERRMLEQVARAHGTTKTDALRKLIMREVASQRLEKELA